MTLIMAAKETSVSVDVGRYVDRVSADILTESRATIGRHQRRVSTDTQSTDALSTHDPGKLRPGVLDLSFCNTHNYPSTNIMILLASYVFVTYFQSVTISST